MAHTKAIGSTQLGRDSQPKYRGVKLHDGQKAAAGNVIIRQTGSTYLAGDGVRVGKDYTLYAAHDGIVRFTTTRKMNYDGSRRVAKVVHVIPAKS
ncbi:MAG: 50S ribosomal protein L27 [Patescibacteria group bacterium]